MKMTELEMHEEAKIVLENNMLDSLLFYLQEYRNDLTYEQIADAFTFEFMQLATQVVKEIKENNKNEGLQTVNPMI